MKKEKDEEFDDLFKKGLEDPVSEAAFRDADWDAMEQMLDKPKRRSGIVYWLPYLSSAAAVVLLFLGWMLFRPQAVKNTKPEIAAVQHPAVDTNGQNENIAKKNTGTSGGTTLQAADSSKHNTSNTANYANSPGVKSHGLKGNSFFTLSSGKARRGTTGNSTKDVVDHQTETTLAANGGERNGDKGNGDQSNAVANNTLASNAPAKLSAADTGSKQNVIANNVSTTDNSVGQPTTPNTDVPAAQPKTAKPVIKQGVRNRPQFALGVLASSDLNGVNSLQGSKVGSNFGLQFSMGLSKWTVSTGVSYAIKPYQTGINNYNTNYQFTTEPTNVSANCRMLDIPLNVNYQVYGKHNNKISVGTGLSSYIMLREDYSFNYANQYAAGYNPAGYSVINKNRTYLGIVNLDVTYQHQINSKVGLLIEPYYKLPLANVGASQVRLQTAGVAVGLNWNLNSLTKP